MTALLLFVLFHIKAARLIKYMWAVIFSHNSFVVLTGERHGRLKTYLLTGCLVGVKSRRDAAHLAVIVLLLIKWLGRAGQATGGCAVNSLVRHLHASWIHKHPESSLQGPQSWGSKIAPKCSQRLATVSQDCKAWSPDEVSPVFSF